MIIFDLDGTLADCEHRRHFVDPSKRNDCQLLETATTSGQWYYKDRFKMCEPPELMKFHPDWKAFYEACDKDTPIDATIRIIHAILYHGCNHIQIWSGRCESVRQKTIDWLEQHIDEFVDWNKILKMRPIGDSTPDDVLKERWLDEALADGKKIEMVFDDRPKVVRMWRRRGIFVFNCAQSDEEF